MITSGDRDGIGLEVTCKALAMIGPQSRARFLMTAHSAGYTDARKSTYFSLLRKKFRIIELPEVPVDSAYEVLRDLEENELGILVDSRPNKKTEADWVLSAARLAYESKIDALVTGPVSKERFQAMSRKYRGHTAVLADIAQTPVFQGYIGPKMAIVLATDHVPLHSVEQHLSAKRLAGAAEATLQLRQLLDRKRRVRPIAWLGLNPHSGENGLIGSFEQRVKLKNLLPRSFGAPVPADTAFSAEKISSTSVYLALYHDQGLIPFKMLHGQDSGFQISLGLPFLRTSVDHGTAKSLFGKGLANAGSMNDAIMAAMTRSSVVASKARRK